MSATTEATLWICESCGFIYDPAIGDPDGGIPPGTAFEDIPSDWFCPVCGARTPTSARSSRARPRPPAAPPAAVTMTHDYDWIVVGSGFGGSVSALRLAEKGYSVAVLECGSRFRDEDFAESTWEPRRYFWSPRLGMRGSSGSPSSRTSSWSAAAASAAAASATRTPSTVPPRPSSRTRSGPTSATGRPSSRPHYETAQRMLGVVVHEGTSPADQLLRELGEELGVGDTYRKTPIGVFLDKPGRDGRRPLLRRRGAGADRLHAVRPLHGRLPHGAKNTLIKNYLWLAEQRGVEMQPERAGDRRSARSAPPTAARATR